MALSLRASLTSSALLALAAGAAAHAAMPADIARGYEQQAGSAAQAARGQQFFNATHGGQWRCASCHGALPTTPGQHAATGKAIAPLAPAFNPARFTDATKVEKWFGRNCRDVVGRECTPAEKADVVAWLMSLKP